MAEHRGLFVNPDVPPPVGCSSGGPPPDFDDGSGIATAAALPPLLTADEHRAVEDAGQLYNLLCRIVGRGPSRAGDLAELVGHIHGIQQAVLKQAAARAYPDRYRLLGGMHGDPLVCG